VRAARHQVLDLALVVRVEQVVDVDVALAQPRTEAVPDRHDLGVVGNGSKKERHVLTWGRRAQPSSGRPRIARPPTSLSASVVGAMTLAARAARKRRSMASSLRNAAPPHTTMDRSEAPAATSPAAALTSRTDICASGRPSSIAKMVVSRIARAWSVW